MKKQIFAILICIFLIGSFSSGVAQVRPRISIEALQDYCKAWNAMFFLHNEEKRVDFLTSDDGLSIDYICISFNSSHRNIDYGIEELPATSLINILYDLQYMDIIIGISDLGIIGNLEDASFNINGTEFRADMVGAETIDDQLEWIIIINQDLADKLFLSSVFEK